MKTAEDFLSSNQPHWPIPPPLSPLTSLITEQDLEINTRGLRSKADEGGKPVVLRTRLAGQQEVYFGCRPPIPAIPGHSPADSAL